MTTTPVSPSDPSGDPNTVEPDAPDQPGTDPDGLPEPDDAED